MMKSDQSITTWWAKFGLECLLIIFIYSKWKFKVTCKNGDFNVGTSELIPKGEKKEKEKEEEEEEEK